MLENKKGQLELDEPSVWVGLLFGIIGALLGVFITARMDGGLFLKLASAVITGSVCFIVGWKIVDSG